MTPFEASQPGIRDHVLNNLYSNIKTIKNSKTFKIGDAYKSKFTKG